MANPYATQGYLNKVKASLREMIKRSEHFIATAADDTLERTVTLQDLCAEIEHAKELLK